MIVKKIAPSMMCVDFFRMEETLRIFEQEKIEFLHIDVMDGVFVPNITLGTDYVRQLRKVVKIPLDFHLMIDEPEKKLPWFDICAGDQVAVHAESCRHLQKTLQDIRAKGARVSVALNPSTPLQALEYILDDLDTVLVMMVNPGFAGQSIIPSALRKLLDAREFLDSRGYNHVSIEVDGNVSYGLAGEMSAHHADIFVAGTSSFLRSGENLHEGIRRFREIIQFVD